MDSSREGSAAMLGLLGLCGALHACAGRVGPTGAWEHEAVEEMAEGAFKYEYDRHFAHALVRGGGPGVYAGLRAGRTPARGLVHQDERLRGGG